MRRSPTTPPPATLIGGWAPAPLETIQKHGLAADLSHPLYGDEKLCINGWGFKAPHNPY
jgi:hypothetical protein